MKKYTKKQITEAIAYWKKQLKLMNESMVFGKKYDHADPKLRDMYDDGGYGAIIDLGRAQGNWQQNYV